VNQALSGTNEPLRRLSPCSFARSGPATPRQDLRWEDQPGVDSLGYPVPACGAGGRPAGGGELRGTCVPALWARCGPEPHRGLRSTLAAVGE